MRAVLYSDWGKLENAELPRPRAGSDEVLVKVSAYGICGSELDTFRSRSDRRRPPLVMGHEFCGLIEEIGAEVRGWDRGEPVISHALVHCGECAFCGRGDTNLCPNRQVFGIHRMGAYAEYVAVPARALVRWPASLSRSAAALAEPLANGVNVVRVSGSHAKDRVLVIGAGPIGLMCLQAARVMCGSSVAVADLVDERLAAARALGADAAVNPKTEDLRSSLMALWGVAEADCVIDAVGSEGTKRQSLAFLSSGGVAVWLGLHGDVLTLDSYDVTLRQKAIVGSYSASLDGLKEAVGLLTSECVDVEGWVKKFPFDQGVTAFEQMLEGAGDNIKAVVHVA
jgi:L-iditol 2-dehydrogenase